VIALDGRGRTALDSLVLQHTDTGRLALAGMLGAAGEVTGTLVADRIPLEDLGRLLGSAQRGRGRMTLTGQVGGTRDVPQGTVGITLAGAEWGRLRLGDFLGAARYVDQRLAIEGAVRVKDQPVLAASASLPLDLALRARARRTVDAPLTGSVRSANIDLGLLGALFPDVTGARGTFDTDIRLAGGWERPRVEGQVRVDSGALTLAPLGIRLEQLQVDVGLRGDSIAIRRLRATSRLPGSRTADSVGVSGVVGITEIANPAFDLTMAASSFLAIDRARSASVAISTPEPIRLVGKADAATVRGALRLDRGRVYINQLTQRRPLDVSTTDALIDTARLDVNALLPSAPNLLMRNLQLDNVRLQVGPDVWLRSPEANLKLGGQLRVTRSAARDLRGPRLALADSLTVERGTYQLNLGIARPGFEVERGLVRFFGDPDLAPTLDITALHTIRETRANSNRQNVLVRVNVGGTLDRPTLALTSGDNPPLPESDMLSYLVTGEPAYALLGTPYAEQGATLALRLAGSYLSSRLAGGRFDVVQVEPTALNPGDAANLRQNGLGILASTRVGVGGQVAPNTYLTFSTGLCGLNPQANGGGDALSLFAQGLGVKVERRFERGLSLALGLEPASSAQACGRLGISRTFQQTPPQVGFDFFRFWTF
jgi:translocation and assembly module TamB